MKWACVFGRNPAGGYPSLGCIEYRCAAHTTSDDLCRLEGRCTSGTSRRGHKMQRGSGSIYSQCQRLAEPQQRVCTVHHSSTSSGEKKKTVASVSFRRAESNSGLRVGFYVHWSKEPRGVPPPNILVKASGQFGHEERGLSEVDIPTYHQHTAREDSAACAQSILGARMVLRDYRSRRLHRECSACAGKEGAVLVVGYYERAAQGMQSPHREGYTGDGKTVCSTKSKLSGKSAERVIVRDCEWWHWHAMKAVSGARHAGVSQAASGQYPGLNLLRQWIV
ncbi:hypothetical protein C8R44DRAFT_724430 [Mycena epipterygia]|nr:hypothetical protein C8R44DRAFT_724430 [Mycena epipterygia]